jgi:transcriptional regulator with XRE-family HTH domain
MNMKAIGKNIAALRKNNGCTQEALAEKLGLSPQAVSKWETGAGLPEASVLVELAGLFRVSIDGILRPDVPSDAISSFVKRNLAIPGSKVLDWVPRISRWDPPDGCDMWYSFPAAIAEALVCAEAREAGRTAIPYAEMNDRFRDLMHITGLGYGFLWNTEKRHLIEELWHVNNISEMVGRVMGYYGRDYLWLTPDNATTGEARRIITWSIAQGRPAVMEWAGGIP